MLRALLMREPPLTRSNVLLEEDLRARLGDLGVAKLVGNATLSLAGFCTITHAGLMPGCTALFITLVLPAVTRAGVGYWAALPEPWHHIVPSSLLQHPSSSWGLRAVLPRTCTALTSC